MTNLQLPPAMAGLRPELGALVSQIEERVSYGAVQLSVRQGLGIHLDLREERVSQISPTAGTVLTAFDGLTIHEQAVAGFDLSAVQAGVKKMALVTQSTHHPKIEVSPGASLQQDFSTPAQIPAESLSTQEKLDRCRDLKNRLSGRDSRVVNIQVSYSENNELSVFCNRAADLAQRIQRLTIFVMVVVAGPQGDIRYNWATRSATGGWEALQFSDEELQSIVDHAAALLTAERIEPGEYTIIAAPTVAGTICHESFGHGVETDMFLKQRAKAAHYLDRPVGSPLVNIWDDPTYPGSFGSYFFDSEGKLATPTRIVEDGIFRRGLTDLYSATMLNVPRSANGRRQDYTRKAYARMSNTFFGAGTTPVEDLFAQVEDGIYLEKWSSGMEDPQGWGIQVTCHYGHEIKHGKVTGRMFAPIGITGLVPDVLQSVTAVGNDFELDGGQCGKGHKEWAPVSSGGPHLLMKARLG